MSNLEAPTRPHPSMLDRGFTVLDNKIFDNLKLSPLARLLLMYLVRYATCPNFVAYNRTKEKWLGCERKKLQALHRELISEGYMVLHKGGGKGGSWYEFHAEPIFLSYSNSESPKKGLSKKGTVRKKTPILNTDLLLNNDLLISTNIKNKQKESSFPKKHSSPSPKARVVCENENLEKQFEQFWKAYDYKKDKSGSLRAFKKALKHASLEQMLKSIQEQAIERSVKLKNGVFTPSRCLPSTWLNKRRWEDYTQSEEEILQEALKKKKGGRTAFERSMDLERRCEKAMDEAILEELGITKDDLEKQFDDQLKNKLDHKG